MYIYPHHVGFLFVCFLMNKEEGRLNISRILALGRENSLKLPKAHDGIIERVSSLFFV